MTMGISHPSIRLSSSIAMLRDIRFAADDSTERGIVVACKRCQTNTHISNSLPLPALPALLLPHTTPLSCEHCTTSTSTGHPLPSYHTSLLAFPSTACAPSNPSQAGS